VIDHKVSEQRTYREYQVELDKGAESHRTATLSFRVHSGVDDRHYNKGEL